MRSKSLPGSMLVVWSRIGSFCVPLVVVADPEPGFFRAEWIRRRWGRFTASVIHFGIATLRRVTAHSYKSYKSLFTDGRWERSQQPSQWSISWRPITPGRRQQQCARRRPCDGVADFRPIDPDGFFNFVGQQNRLIRRDLSDEAEHQRAREGPGLRRDVGRLLQPPARSLRTPRGRPRVPAFRPPRRIRRAERSTLAGTSPASPTGISLPA